MEKEQQIAITKDGQNVLLKPDGTWSIITETPQVVAKSDFRKASWGMSKAQVLATEITKPVREEENILIYAGTLLGLSCELAYIFAQGHLVRAKYMITAQHSNQNRYITDCENIKEVFNKKYGKPVDDKTYWSNDLYKDDYESWGMAISTGHLSYFTNWATTATEIVLALLGDNYEIQLGVEYSSKKLLHLENTAQERETLDMI